MKELVIIAGPNGSGKSTLASQIDFAGKYISADKCEKNFLAHITDVVTREQQAVLVVAKEIKEHIRLNLPFAFETVFAISGIPTFLKTAKEKGYSICLHYRQEKFWRFSENCPNPLQRRANMSIL